MSGTERDSGDSAIFLSTDGQFVTSEGRSAHEQQDARRLRQLRGIMEQDPASREANQQIADLIVGWRRHYEPWLVLEAGKRIGNFAAGRQVADPVVSSVETRLLRLLRRKQQFSTSWRMVVWATVRHELDSELRRLGKRADKETAVGEIYGDDGVGTEPGHDPIEEIDDSSEYDFERLRRARSGLTPSDDELLRRVFDDELSGMEAAARLEITPNNLGVKKLRALERLRAAWAAEGEDV